jgi:predicted nucleic acid-binding protein
MVGGLAEPVVLDATVLSNFASSGAVGWLVELLDSPAVPLAVEAKIERGRAHGHEFLDDAMGAIGDGIPVLEVEREQETAATTDVDATLDAGEAAALRLSIGRDGMLATDDLAARNAADEHGVPVTGSIGLLVLGIEQDALKADTANEWLSTWRTERGYYAPVDRIQDVLDSGPE